MSEREKLPPETSMAALRERNGKEELDELGRLFGQYFKDAVEPQKLREELKKSIQDNVSSQMTAVRDEFKQQLTDSRIVVVKAITDLGGELRKEIRLELRNNLQGLHPQEPPAKPRDEGLAPVSLGDMQANDLPTVSTGSSGAPPVVQPPSQNPKPKNHWKSLGAAAVVLITLMLGAYSLFNDPDEESSQHDPQDGTDVSVTQPVDSQPEISKDPVPPEDWIAWMEEAEAQLPKSNAQVSERAASFPWSAQFACWFKDSNQARLYGLLIEENQDAEDLKGRLGTIFTPCEITDYTLAGHALAIFGAQVTVHRLLKSKAANWGVWCPTKVDAPPGLATFKADGYSGNNTNNLLNDFLACTEVSSRLTIDVNSKTEEYLFTLYAALKELQREP